MLSKQLEEGFDSPQVQIEYNIFSICSDIKRLCDDFDSNRCLEAFFTQQSCEDINLAAVRLSSIAAAICKKD
jgi:hypothetical protein